MRAWYYTRCVSQICACMGGHLCPALSIHFNLELLADGQGKAGGILQANKHR